MDPSSDNFIEQLLPYDMGETKRTAIKNKCYEVTLAIKSCRNHGKQSTFRSDTRTIVMQAHQQNIIVRISDNVRPGIFIHLSELTIHLPLTVQNLVSGLLNNGAIILDGAYMKITKSPSNIIIGLIISCIFHIDMVTDVKPPVPPRVNKPVLKLSNSNVMETKVPSLAPQYNYQQHHGKGKHKGKHNYYYQPPKQEVRMEYIVENPDDRTRYHAIIMNDINEFKDRKALVMELVDMYGLDFKPKDSSKFLATCVSLEESISMPHEVKIPVKPTYNLGNFGNFGNFNWGNMWSRAA